MEASQIKQRTSESEAADQLRVHQKLTEDRKQQTSLSDSERTAQQTDGGPEVSDTN